MKQSKSFYGKTFVSLSPYYGYLKNGHRLICSDGVMRAAELSQSPDTFFSVPATVRIGGHRVTGYMTTEDGNKGTVYAFRHHNGQDDNLPSWPSSYTSEHETIVSKAY